MKAILMTAVDVNNDTPSRPSAGPPSPAPEIDGAGSVAGITLAIGVLLLIGLAIPLMAAAVLCASPAAYSQQFEAWQGKPVVHEGEGGTKQVVDGIDVWDRGTPPGKFIVIGYIHDKRHKSGLIGKVRMSHLDRDVARVAKQASGDAVIAVSSEDETLGVVGGSFASTNASAQAVGNSAYGQAHTSSFGFSKAVREQESEFAVLKYVPDTTAAAPTMKAPVIAGMLWLGDRLGHSARAR